MKDTKDITAAKLDCMRMVEAAFSLEASADDARAVAVDLIRGNLELLEEEV